MQLLEPNTNGNYTAMTEGRNNNKTNQDSQTVQHNIGDCPLHILRRIDMAEEAPPVAEPEPAPEELPPPPPPKDPRRKLVFRHWIRPTFLNYHFIYDYRHNYYDDVIDFMDRRQRGLTRDLPRPQTWAERALRTYTFKPSKNDFVYYTAFRKEEYHCYKVAHTYRADHTKDYFSRKFKSVLY